MGKCMVKTRVKIYGLLCSGNYPASIARKLKISQPAVHKHIKKLVESGLIERTGTKPAFYRKKDSGGLRCKSGGTSKPNEPILVPHKLGASFILIGRPRLSYDKHGIATIKELGHTIRFGRSKAVIWLKVFPGSNVRDIIATCRQQILDIARFYEQKHAVTLTFNRWFRDIEWVLGDKPASKKASEMANIKPKRVIAGAEFKFDDATHPKRLEVNKAVGYPPDIPTQHAETLEYLLLKAPKDIEDATKLLLESAKRIAELTESITVTNQKLEILNKKLEG